MSDFLTNEEGRAEGIGAPAGAWEKTVEFDIDTIEDASILAPETPSKHEPDALDAHASAGHDLIPIEGKVPVEKGWRRASPLSLEKAKARMSAGRNVGVRLRATDLVVDVDPRNFVAGDDPLVRLKADFGLPFAPLVKTGGGGQHLYLRKPEDAEIINGLPNYEGIEFKSFGRQVVAAGSIHPETGKPYSLDDDPLAEVLRNAPEATTALLDAIAKRSIDVSADAHGEVTPEQLERLLSKLDVMAYNGRHDDWLAIMMASHRGTGGAGIDEFVAWSVSDAAYADDEADIRRRWASFKPRPGGVTLGTLLKVLSDAGHGAFIEEVLRAPATEDFPDDIAEAVEVAPEERKQRAVQRHGVWDDWLFSIRREWVKRLLKLIASGDRRRAGPLFSSGSAAWLSQHGARKRDGTI